MLSSVHHRGHRAGMLPLAPSNLRLLLSLMGQYSNRLDGIFIALGDPTRRAVLGRLGRGPATVSELAEPFSMALPSFMKHIRLLERCGLIRTRKKGRVRTCAIEKNRLAVVEAWLSKQRALWEGPTDKLEQFVITAHGKEQSK